MKIADGRRLMKNTNNFLIRVRDKQRDTLIIFKKLMQINSRAI